MMNLRYHFCFLAFVTTVFALQWSAALAQSTIDASRFLAPKKSVYTLDDGDTLGVFVEGVVGDVGGMPPVHQPAPGSDLPPAIGFPTLVLHDGTIRLPLVDPISVRGLSVAQVESLLKKTFRAGSEPIIAERSRVLVSLIRKRTVNVLVVRGDQSQAQRDPRLRQQNRSGPVSSRSDGSGRIYNLNLPAGDNDLLNAMMGSGGFPGVNAKDQLQVFRNVPGNGQRANSPSNSFPRTGRAQNNRRYTQSFPVRSNGSRSASPFPRTQARLNDGDIVSIASKPTEVFYTGGLLGGGEFVIPRDRALSITDAVAQVGGIPQAQRGLAAVPLQQPRVLTLIRQSGGRQFSQQFDLRSGYSQRAAQTRVRSGDYLILDYSPRQRVQNLGVGVFNTFGVQQLFRN